MRAPSEAECRAGLLRGVLVALPPSLLLWAVLAVVVGRVWG